MVFKRKEEEVVSFRTASRVSLPTVGRCEVVLGDKMEEMEKFKYLGTLICKHGEMEG